ncbi:hypothetical protein PR202_ga18545 [Eleusine coracana subsp. coracana]|uniref:RCK N-terminal domain-containing protein n=1 Tax=Eleusine coracana subsp. coracana TaxID=191504 RepID=A0AAV5CTE8_ELECO|nr:hypothetical protein PR202_ga18545 [Eleusine coracana subsp. coracana]
MFEEKAQRISESAIALKARADSAQRDVSAAVTTVQEIISKEADVKEAVQKATMALSMAEARLQLAAEAMEAKEGIGWANGKELRHIQERKRELQKEVDRLTELAEKALLDASKAEEDVANIMVLAEQAVALEMEAAQHANDAELALQKAEKAISSVDTVVDLPPLAEEQKSIEEDHDSEVSEYSSDGIYDISDRDEVSSIERLMIGDLAVEGIEKLESSREISDEVSSDKLPVEPQKETEPEIDNKPSKQGKKQETERKELTKGPFSAPKALLKRSSRFFSASSFFSSKADGEIYTYICLPRALFLNRAQKSQLFQQQGISTSIEKVTSTTKPIVREIQHIPQRVQKLIELLPHQGANEEEASLFDVLYLLLASVIFVPLFQKIPGGSPVLGYLAAGVLIGPYGLSIIRNVHGTKAIAEFGVVFLLFNIGLELSVERLSSMKKYVFGLGSAQVLVTTAAVGMIAHRFAALPGPAAIVIGSGLALSSTAVVLQVLQERSESTSRHGRATFSVLLFQVGFQAIAEAMGMAAVKAVAAITAIIAGGRLLLRPIYKQIAENRNPEIFSANTLLVIFGTSLLTARAGLSMALGAFLAGLLLAETEFSLQVESDIAPYRGLLLGLFFMTVGMSIDPKLLLSNFPSISVILSLLIIGKTLLVTFVGRLFGVSTIAAVRVGLMLAPGGEFAFVAFGEAVNQGLLSPQLSSLLFLVVGISMALTPYLAAGGQFLASKFEQHDVRSLLPVESETDDLQDHIIILGLGRVGQIIAQLLSERLIPFVALDVRSDRVAVGRALDLPVYFGDAGSREVLHKVGAERACAAAITLDTPGANYRAVWALNKYFPNVKTFVRAHDVGHGINLEKAGATAVGFQAIAEAMGMAAVKAVAAITAIIAGGRLFIWNDDNFFLNSYTDARLFGVSTIAAVRVGLMLAPGGEFAFVAFGEAVNQGLLSPQLSSLLFLVVGISMALTPYLAAGVTGLQLDVHLTFQYTLGMLEAERAVWALNKYFPNVKTFVRAHDVGHGINLEKAGATAVVPETLEPSLQLAAAVLAQAKLPMSEIQETINEFRNRHLSELTELCATSGSSLGYGFSRVMSMSKSKSPASDDESETVDGTLAI